LEATRSRGDLVHYRTGCRGGARTVGGLEVGVVVLGAVGRDDPPRAVDAAALLLDVAVLLARRCWSWELGAGN
jgi:hypothetical protein